MERRRMGDMLISIISLTTYERTPNPVLSTVIFFQVTGVTTLQPPLVRKDYAMRDKDRKNPHRESPEEESVIMHLISQLSIGMDLSKV